MRNQSKIWRVRRGGRAGEIGAVDFDEHMEVRLPDLRVLRLVARSLLLSVVIFWFPWPGTRLGVRSPPLPPTGDGVTGLATTTAARSRLVDDAFFHPMLFRDLKRLGLLRPGSRAVFLGHTNPASPFLKQNKMNHIAPGDKHRQRSIPDHTIEFVFTDGSGWPKFIDRVLKIGGIVAVKLGSSSSETLRVPSSYKTLYIRRFDSTIVAMRKMWHTNAVDLAVLRQGRRLLTTQPTIEAALSQLEGVLLDPPRTLSRPSNKYPNRIRFFSDLTGGQTGRETNAD